MATKPKKTRTKKNTLTTEPTTDLKEDMIEKETPTSLPVDPKTGREIPTPKEVLGETAPDTDNLPTMIGTTIYTGG